MDEELQLLEDMCPPTALNDSYISQGDYDDLAVDVTRDVVVETSADTDEIDDTPEGDLPVNDNDTTARIGQRVVSDAMEVTGEDGQEPAAAAKKTRKRKRNPTVVVEGVEHVIVPALEWRTMTQLVGEMRTLKKRVNLLETEALRKNQGGTPAKKVKMSEQSLSERLKNHPHLVNPKLFKKLVVQGSC
jgi:hypothetical protein